MLLKKNIFSIFLFSVSIFLPITTIRVKNENFQKHNQGNTRTKIAANHPKKSLRNVSKFMGIHSSKANLFSKLKSEITTTNLNIYLNSGCKYDYSIKYDNYDTFGVKHNGYQNHIKKNSNENIIKVGINLFQNTKIKINSGSKGWSKLTIKPTSQLDFNIAKATSIKYYISATGTKSNPTIKFNRSYINRITNEIVINTLGVFGLNNSDNFFTSFVGILIGLIILSVVTVILLSVFSMFYSSINARIENVVLNPNTVKNIEETIEDRNSQELFDDKQNSTLSGDQENQPLDIDINKSVSPFNPLINNEEFNPFDGTKNDRKQSCDIPSTNKTQSNFRDLAFSKWQDEDQKLQLEKSGKGFLQLMDERQKWDWKMRSGKKLPDLIGDDRLSISSIDSEKTLSSTSNDEKVITEELQVEQSLVRTSWLKKEWRINTDFNNTNAELITNQTANDLRNLHVYQSDEIQHDINWSQSNPDLYMNYRIKNEEPLNIFSMDRSIIKSIPKVLSASENNLVDLVVRANPDNQTYTEAVKNWSNFIAYDDEKAINPAIRNQIPEEANMTFNRVRNAAATENELYNQLSGIYDRQEQNYIISGSESKNRFNRFRSWFRRNKEFN